jgi:cytochrome c oxidase subunit 3
MILAYRAAKSDEIGKIKLFTTITLGLGLTFCISQWLGWNQMVAQKMFFSGDSASFSFVYVLSGLHLAHIIGGIIALLVLLIKITQFKVHKKSMLSMQLIATYWHFVGVLWIYLFLFLTFA